jgi:hypothetical protein
MNLHNVKKIFYLAISLLNTLLKKTLSFNR